MRTETVTILTILPGAFPPPGHDLHFWQFNFRAVFQVIGRRIPLLVADAGVTSAFEEEIPDRVGILARGAIVQRSFPLLNRTRISTQITQLFICLSNYSIATGSRFLFFPRLRRTPAGEVWGKDVRRG